MKKESLLTTAWFTVNRNCQFHCEWCYAKESTPSQIMDFEKAKSTVDALHKKGIKKIILIGGEPLLYKNIITLAEYIAKKNILVSIATNGQALKSETLCKNIVLSGVKNVNISLKGTSENEYEHNVGSKGLQTAIDGYHNLKNAGLNPTLSYVIVSRNTDDIKRLITLAKENNLDNFSFQYVKPVITKNSPEILDLFDMGKILCNIYDLMNESGLSYTIEISFPLCLIPKEYRDEIISSGHIYTGCHIRRGSGMIFDTDFKVLPCNHFVDMPYKKEVPSQINIDYINNFQNSKEVTAFKDKLRFYPSTKCSTCELWDKCGGGCFTRWLFKNPETYCIGI